MRLNPKATSFRNLDRIVVWCWRLGLGKWLNCCPRYGGRIMVLQVRGRKSGRVRSAPLNYAPGQGEVFCVAGFGGECQWYQNLKAHPQVEVWLPEGRRRGLADTVTDPEARVRRLREVLKCSGFAAKLFGGIDLDTISEQDLARQTADYLLVRVRLLEPVTGPGGPGDRIWVWPLLALAGLALLRSLPNSWQGT